MDNTIDFANAYAVDSDLSGGERYRPFNNRGNRQATTGRSYRKRPGAKRGGCVRRLATDRKKLLLIMSREVILGDHILIFYNL